MKKAVMNKKSNGFLKGLLRDIAKVKEKTRTLTYSQAISESLVQAMRVDESVFIMGLGVTDYKGIFNTTVDAHQKFKDRVIETPASENALTGICIGAALTGRRPVLVHARHDFMFLALDQMINTASKWRYAYGGSSTVPVVIRAIVGKGWGQGPTHSQSLQAVFAHFPGLKVLMPATPIDVKGMMIHSLRQDAPTVIIEHRALYDTVGEVPNDLYEVESGIARVVKVGSDLTIIATSYLIGEALMVSEFLESKGISVEIIDPRSIRPLDKKTIVNSVNKTKRALCLDTSWTMCGFSAEVAAIICEECFSHLKAPVKRLGMADCPAPVSKQLEDEFYPSRRKIAQICCQLVEKKIDLSGLEESADIFKGPY